MHKKVKNRLENTQFWKNVDKMKLSTLKKYKMWITFMQHNVSNLEKSAFSVGIPSKNHKIRWITSPQ